MAELVNEVAGKVAIVTGSARNIGRTTAEDLARAGASLVQLYTALVFGGPSLIPKIKHDLAFLLAKDGFKSVNDNDDTR